MKDTLIYLALERMELPGVDVEHYIGWLFSFEENTWFAPANEKIAGANLYDICFHLSQWHLIETSKKPKWTLDGLYRGNKIMFRYRADLQYNEQ